MFLDFTALKPLIIEISIVLILIYIYLGFAFMAIGRKAKLAHPGLAWIPSFGPMIIAFQTSKMHWWPWLLLVGGMIPIIGFIASIGFFVFHVIWRWKMFEAVGKPGWWSIIAIFPLVNLVLYGIAAWSKN